MNVNFDPPIKVTASIPVSCCLLTDSTGENHCQHPPPKPSRRKRLWWQVRNVWYMRPRVHFGPCDHEDCF